jgi:hypothetical protein
MSAVPEVERWSITPSTQHKEVPQSSISAALLLDAAVQVCQVLSLRTIYTLAPALRGRLNGLFVASAFLGGATGSGFAPAVYAWHGWTAVGGLGALFVAFALARFGSELRSGSGR